MTARRTPSPSRRAVRAGAVGLAAALALSGCEFEGVYSVPLPGGKGGGENAYKVQVEFENVLDLVPQSMCQVDQVAVGSVTDIQLDGYMARVTCSIQGDVVLPEGTTASLRQTSLLGEKYVAFLTPENPSGDGRIRAGELIPVSQTNRYPELEEVFTSLSLLLNGGGLQQLSVINRELDAALGGREEEIGELLDSLDQFVGTLDEQKQAIIRALEGLDRLAVTLNADREILATALEDIPPGLDVLTDSRDELVAALQSLDRLSEVAVRVIAESKDATRENLESLDPILSQLAASGRDFTRALEFLPHYPQPKTAPEAGMQGDYANLWVTLSITSEGLLAFLRSEIERELSGGGGGEPPQPAPPEEGGDAPAPPSLPLPLEQPPTLPQGLDLGSVLGIPGQPAPPGSPTPPPLPGEAPSSSQQPESNPVPGLPGSGRTLGSAGPGDLSSLLIGGGS